MPTKDLKHKRAPRKRVSIKGRLKITIKKVVEISDKIAASKNRRGINRLVNNLSDRIVDLESILKRYPRLKKSNPGVEHLITTASWVVIAQSSRTVQLLKNYGILS